MSLTTLGGFELRIGGVHAEPGGRKLAALLCVLALDGTVGRERLAELLWPAADPEAARLSVRQALWRLRQVVGDVLISSRYAAQLDLSRVEVDAPQFLARARHAPPLETLRRYGPFLDGLVLEGEALEAWAQAHRESCHRQATRALAELLRTLPPGEGLEEATGFWQRLAPTDGPLTRTLLRGLTVRGELQAAARVLDHHRAALREELDAVPDPETERLLAPQRVVPAALAFAFSVPAPATPLLGREEELQLLGELWLGGARLVTLLGPGGTGKTHLALHYARRAAGSPGLPDLGGVAAVRLDTLGAPGELLGHVAAALRFAAPAHLLAALRHTPTLLVLDNFEPLLRSGAGAARAAVGELLAAAPELRLLVTSRERLNVAGEGVLTLDGLDSGGPEGGAAAELLRRAAQRAAPRRVPGPAEARQIAQLTQGHPLLLELTAGALASLEPGEVLRGLRTSLLELRGGPADWPARHLASASVLDSSFARLDPAALRGLRQLAVVGGDYAPADARALVGQVGAWQQLQDLGLLIQQGEGLRLHELVRQQALSGADLDALRERHAAHYAARAGQLRADLRGEQQLAALQELRRGEHHFRAAAGHVARQGPDLHRHLAPLLDALGLFLWMAGRLPDLLALTSALEATPGNKHQHPVAQSWHGLALAMNGEAERGLALLEGAAPALDQDAAQGGLGALLGLERLAFAQQQLRRTGAALATYEVLEVRAKGRFPALHGRALLGQASALQTTTNDESPTTTALVAQGAAVLAGSGDLHGLAQALSQQSSDELNMGEVSDQTAPRVGRTLALRETLGDARGLVVSTLHLAGVATARGDDAEALATVRQALERARLGGDEVLIADVHYVLARTLQRAGDLAQAHLEMRAAGELYRQNGSHREVSTYLERADFALTQRDWAASAALARRAAEVAWAAGQSGMALFGLAICAQALAGGRPDDALLPELVHTVLTHPGTFRNARDRLTPLGLPPLTSAALPVGDLLRRLG
ncbi:ATP-binding protein [Deinococcus petrolearius]|uniref:ATP-binding protein n=1 Tax=Deinococcus petrolearius TaxID=1751295 RepID=A0ABW1DHG0_9DEIO